MGPARGRAAPLHRVHGLGLIGHLPRQFGTTVDDATAQIVLGAPVLVRGRRRVGQDVRGPVARGDASPVVVSGRIEVAVARAIARGVFEAESTTGTVSYRDKFFGGNN